MHFYLISVFVLLVTQSTSGYLLQNTKFKDCGSTGELINAEIIPCDTSPCTLYKGENTQIKLKFKTKKPVATGKAVVHGVIMGVEVPFPIDDSSLCSHVIPNCPLKADETEYEYSYSFPILKAYPSMKLNVKYELMDESGASVVCALMPVQLANR